LSEKREKNDTAFCCPKIPLSKNLKIFFPASKHQVQVLSDRHPYRDPMLSKKVKLTHFAREIKELEFSTLFNIKKNLF